MKAKLSRIRLRDVALFGVVAGVVAVVVVIAGREAGIGERAGAGVEAEPAQPQPQAQEDRQEQAEPTEPLTLTLNARRICETEPGSGGAGLTAIVDDDGEIQSYESEFLGWWGVAEIPVNWQITGGTAPFQLEIDGERRDASGTYQGESGTASVSCATTTLDRVWDYADDDGRGFAADPEVDSGPKTVRAVVTDANGQTAEASVEIYVILDFEAGFHVMRRGQTYRVFGFLITAPPDYDLRLAGVGEPDCSDVPEGERCGASFAVQLVGAESGVTLYLSDGAEDGRWNWSRASQTRETAAQIQAALDAVVESVGKVAQ